jgi:hypothetical protein
VRDNVRARLRASAPLILPAVTLARRRRGVRGPSQRGDDGDIYTVGDRVVAWTSCLDDPGPLRDNVAVAGAHSTMLGNPEVLKVVAERFTSD